MMFKLMIAASAVVFVRGQCGTPREQAGHLRGIDCQPGCPCVYPTHPRATASNGDPCLLTDRDCITGHTGPPPRTPNTGRCDPGCEDGQVCMPDSDRDRDDGDQSGEGESGLGWSCLDTRTAPTARPPISTGIVTTPTAEEATTTAATQPTTIGCPR